MVQQPPWWQCLRRFKQWTDENSAVASTDQLFTAGGINSSKAYKAVFDVLKWKLEYASLGSGMIAGDALQHVIDGQEGTQVTAQGSDPDQFVGWTDGVLAATRKDMPSKDTKITAQFASVASLPLTQDFENPNSLKDWLVVPGPRNSGWIWEVDIPSQIQATSHMLWHHSNSAKSEGKHHHMGLVAPWVDVAGLQQGVLVEFDLQAQSFMTGQDTIAVRYRTSTDKGWNDWSVMETILPLDEEQDEALHVSTGLTSQQLAGVRQLQVMLEYSVGYSEFAGIDNLAIKAAVTPVSMRMEPEELEFNPGDNLVQLRVKVDPADALARVTWKSEDESIATVDASGWVKPLRPGTVNIVATSVVAPSVTASCKVTVGYADPSEIAVTPSSAELKVGATQQLSFEVSPSTAKQAVLWESSDESVATVDANGLVTAIAKGNTTITATHVDDSNVAGTCQITVLESPQPTSVAVAPTTLALKVGETGELTATVLPADAEQSVTWTSADTSIATVDAHGKVTAVAVGTVKIVATSTVDATLKGECEVTVTQDSLAPTSVTVLPEETKLKVGESFQLKAVVAPLAAPQTVSWESADASIATVDAQGKMIAVAVGTVKIVATSTVDATLKGECEVTVTPAGQPKPSPTKITVTPTTLTLKVGTTGALTATVLPAEAEQSVVWTSAAPAIATVDAQCKVAAVAVGRARLVATSTVDANVKGECVGRVVAAEQPYALAALAEVAASPNPFSEVLTLTGVSHAEQVQLLNSNGVEVYRATLQGLERIQLPLGHLPKGAYLVLVTGQGERKTLRVVKE